MYKLLLCLRYLRTRYIALASIVSVMLGVATMIVVNSVMAGFQDEMNRRLHGILSDLVVESHGTEGIANPIELMEDIRDTLGDDVVAMTPNIHIPSMLSFEIRGEWVTKPITLIGIDTATYSGVSDFSKFLLHPRNREQLEFRLREGGFGSRLEPAGFDYRRRRVAAEIAYQSKIDAMTASPTELVNKDHTGGDPFMRLAPEAPSLEAMMAPHTGIVLGISIASIRQRDEEGEVADYFLRRPGDDVRLTFPTASIPPELANQYCTVVDFYESKMSEYDANFAFVPLDNLQSMRGMIDPQTGIGAATAIQIRLAEGANLELARDRLRAKYPPHLFPYRVQSWKDMQGPLLAAVQMETTLLNILLFLIIAVAGFGILATFFMIVVEKTKDIGILKSLGASSHGIMSVFVTYGFSLGIVGSGVGVVLGLTFVVHINRIAALIEMVTGREVFDPTIYYFQRIPTIIHGFTVGWIMVGAILIAVMASVLPALRAARLHPVEALRYE